MTPSIFPKRQRPFLLKWQLIGCSSSVVPWCHCPGDFCLGDWNDIFSLQKRFSTGYSCEAVTEKALHTEVLHMLSEIHRYRKLWFPIVWSGLPYESCSPRSGHGTDIMPMDPFDQTKSVWEKRCAMVHMWDILNLKPWEFNDGHQELLLWRSVEVDGKEDPSDGWSSWMNTIISLCRLIATTLNSLQS